MTHIALLLLLSNVVLPSADTTVSMVFREKPSKTITIKVLRSPDVTYQLWEGFTLVRNANAGDPAALHELGLRYLTGQGFTADTLKAFELIRKAAEKNYLLAHFNMAVFYHNGWGVAWNPFNAYKHFQYAAEQGLREGAFAYGLQFTDNLVVRRNWKKALLWIQKSAELGYAPAKEILPDIERYASQQNADSLLTPSDDSPQSSQSYSPILLDFANTAEEEPKNNFSLVEILYALGPLWQNKIKSFAAVNDSILFSELLRHAEWGVPEEFTVIGRCYENGIAVQQDSLQAVVHYMRAVRLESRRAPAMLLRLLNSESLWKKIQQRANRGDAEMQYLIACIALTEILPSQKKEDIISFFLKSAQQQYVASLLELGTAYFNGQIVPQHKERAFELWTHAYQLGSSEALVRMASVKMLTGTGELSMDSSLTILLKATDEASLLAEVTLAYCYEKGIEVQKKIAESVRRYRNAANRGSKIAFESLKRLYDSVRPREKEFEIGEQ
jgi:TPR repeat protein